jgi:hypothetical protein
VTTETWLPGFQRVDLRGRWNGGGNGPFGPGFCLGPCLHVNVGDTPDQFFENGGGPSSVLPNFQIHGDGRGVQFLPIEWSPWCQSDGNGGPRLFGYGAIECAGDVGYPMNDAQLAKVAAIVRAYHDVLGTPLVVANRPGDHGVIYHAAGGAAWGGHPCPGPIRIAQLPRVLQLAQQLGIPTNSEDDMATFRLGKNPNGPDVWIGDGLTRRQVGSLQELADIGYLFGLPVTQQLGSNPGDHGRPYPCPATPNVADLNALGRPA